MKLNELDTRQKIFLQLGVALIVALMLQFIIPQSWQPFNAIVGNVFGTVGGAYFPIVTLNTWFFGLAIAWFSYRENRYLNSLLMYSLIPLAIILFVEFFFYHLFWDFIHLLPFIVDIYVIWKKRSTLRQRFIVLGALMFTGLLLLGFVLDVSYSAFPTVLFLACMPIYFGVMAGLAYILPPGSGLKKGLFRKIGKGVLIGFWGLGLLLGTVILYWYLRPSTWVVNEEIVLDTWVAVDEGKHNSNSFMIYWNETGASYLAHDRRPFHLGTPNAKIVVWNTTNFQEWTKVAEFTIPNHDTRDPKFAVINNRLFLYFLVNKAFPMAFPYTTYYSYTDDGVVWQPVQPIAPNYTLFWAPKTYDNVTWYLPAYTRDPYSVLLLNSTDGENWNVHATMYQGEHISESAIQFLPDGRMMLVARMEGSSPGAFGSANASTLIATSPAPYTDWSSYIKSTVDKLDGLAVFNYQNYTFAAARRQPGSRGTFTWLGSVFTKKRTGLYLVNETTGLIYITDFPSTGDTAYCGVVLNGTEAYISYYTSNINFDYPWALGWFAESDIRIARVNLTALVAFAQGTTN